MNVKIPSHEQKEQTAFIYKTKEKEPIVQWEQASILNRLVNTMAYVQRVFNRHKPATKTLSVKERENAQACNFRILQQEQFAEEMKSLKAEKGIPKNSKIRQFSAFIDEQGLTRAQGRIGKNLLNFEIKQIVLAHWKHHVVELFLRIEHENSRHKSTQQVRNMVQQKFLILGHTKCFEIDQKQMH